MILDDPKLYYDLAKITDQHKVITDDFMDKVCLALFNNYLDSLGEDKLAFCAHFMATWEVDIILQKQNELANLADKGETMSDMVTGAYLSSSEDLAKFKSTVSNVKEILFEALMR